MKIKSSLLTILTLIALISALSAQNKAITNFGNVQGIIYDICFSKDGSMLVIPEGNTIKVFNAKTQQLLYTLSGGHSKEILSVDISPDNSRVISGGKDSLIILWDLKAEKIISKFNYHKGIVTSVKFSPNLKEIASGSTDNTVVLYNLDLNKIMYQFTEHSGDISSVTFNSTGEILASSGEDKCIIFHNTQTGIVINTLKENKDFVREIKFSQNDTRFIACDDNSTVIIWKVEDIGNIKTLRTEKYSLSWFTSADFFKDSQTFAIGSIDGKIKLFTGFSETVYKIKKPIHKILFIPNMGNYIKFAVATHGNGVLILDTAKWKE